ncbi:hypothetical protein TUM17384_13700 [Shewanella algae]|nr:hypothetical protein TUM17384_13700 [Shewanella algae]
MRRFDNAMKNGCDVYYYARYVDDIIIFYTGEKEDLFKIINENLNKFTDKLELNPKKTDFYYLNNNSEKVINLDYLGYRIEIHPKNIDNEHKRIVKTYISDKKINKIKFRIRRSFSSYNRNRNFKILHSRLKFLSGNQYIIGDIERTKLKSGIYYNYPLITEKNQLKELDSFYRKFIKSKNPVITKSMNMIKNHKVTSGKSRFDILNSISFEFGYNLRVMNNFSNKIRKEIKRCW